MSNFLQHSRIGENTQLYMPLDYSSRELVRNNKGIDSNISFQEDSKFQSLYLNGTSTSKVTLSQKITFANDFSVSFWIKPPAVEDGSWGPIITDNALYGAIFFYNYSPFVGIFNFSGNVVTAANTTPLTGGQWHFCVFTKKGNTTSIFINGVQNGSSGTITTNVGYDTIGQSAGYSAYLKANLARLTVWDKALTQYEIQRLYNGNKGIKLISHSLNIVDNLYTGLLASWRFEGNSNDSYGSANGTDTNITYVAEKFGSSASFNGTSSKIVTTDIPALYNVTKMSISAFVLPNVVTGNQTIIKKWNWPSSGAVFELETIGVGLFCFIANSTGDGGSNYGVTTDVTLSTTTLNHIVVVYDGTKSTNAERLKIFVNKKQATMTFGGTIPSQLTNGTAPVSFGDFDTLGRQFNGKILNAEIWARALELKQIYLLNNNGKSLML